MVDLLEGSVFPVGGYFVHPIKPNMMCISRKSRAPDDYANICVIPIGTNTNIAIGLIKQR